MRFILAVIFAIFCSVASAVEPTILVNSATGSDTEASGAGPSTALFGAAGVTAADGLTVILDGTPNLSGVATDGSAVLFMSDTNAGSKNFCKITAVDDGTDTVTVATAFQALNTDAWAIGGKRASVASTTSKKLFETNGTAGDALPGWTIEMGSGHTETIAATVNFRRAGDTTSGRIVLQGTPGAVTPPVLTFSNNGVAFANASAIGNWTFQYFTLKNSNATKTASQGFGLAASGSGMTFRGLIISDASNKFWQGIYTNAASNVLIDGCDIGNTANHGIHRNSSTNVRITNNYIHGCGGHGINLAAPTGYFIYGNIIASNTGDGINFTSPSGCFVSHNTIYGNGGDGIEVSADAGVSYSFENNQITDNSGYGVNFSGGSQLVGRNYSDTVIRGNNTYNNTLGATNPTSISLNDPAVNPGYTNVGAFNWAISSATAGMGHPEGVIFGSGTASYPDPGAAQQQPATAANLALPSLGRRWR